MSGPKSVQPDGTQSWPIVPPSSPCPPAVRRRRSRSCAFPVRRRGNALERLIGRCRSRARRRSRACAIRRAGEVIDEALALWFPGAAQRDRRGHRRAATAWRPRGDRRACSARSRRSKAAGRPRPASSRAAPSRTAGSISPRWKGLADLIVAETPGAAPAGVPPAEGAARRPRRSVAAAADRGAGAGRGADRFFRRGRRAGGFDGAGARDCARPAR